ncbi:MAG: hypothetical protein QW356_05490 [Candidatus Hadarchaeales archaeon]
MKAESGRIIFFFLTVSTLVGAMLYLTIESAGKTIVIPGLFVVTLLILLEAVNRTQRKLGWWNV